MKEKEKGERAKGKKIPNPKSKTLSTMF